MRWSDFFGGVLLSFVAVHIVLLLGILLCRCGPLAPLPDASTEAECRAACDNLQRLDVPGWRGSPGRDEQLGTGDDVPCWRVCVETEAGGYPFNARCIAVATTREGAEACHE